MRGLSKHRLEALVDGIFAVAMTLLVLDIKLPDDTAFHSDGELWDHLLALERHLVIYVITFVVIGRYWSAHNLQFHFVHGVDRRMVSINLLYLLIISFLPFATDLVGDHKDLALPCVIYGATLIALNGVALAHTRYLRRHPGLVNAAFTPEIAWHFERRALMFMIVPAASMVIAFMNTHAALYVYGLMVVGYLAGNPITDRIVHAAHEAQGRESTAPTIGE
jgi:TMEM175 potassium channel family protein